MGQLLQVVLHEYLHVLQDVFFLVTVRKDPVKIPSNLEVDVIDITNTCEDLHFIKPLSLFEASQCEDKFPFVAEILESSKSTSLMKDEIFSSLRKGQKIVVQKKNLSRKILATANKGKLSRFFYIHDTYQGKFRQRPREFATIYDLWAQVTAGYKLKVVVTQDCETSEGPSLYIGDHLQVLNQTKTRISTGTGLQEVDLLVCRRDSGDDEEESEEVTLPLYLEGRFVEEVTNNKRYTLSNLIQSFKLPCEMKVVAKDPSMNTDPLSSFAFLRLEELIEDPVLLISVLENPFECFELPIKYSDFSLILLEDTVPSSKELKTINHIEELTECFYYEVRKQVPNNELPPPRPPKRQVTTKEESKCNISKTPKKSVPTDLKISTTDYRKPNEKWGLHSDTELPETSALCKNDTYSPPPQKCSAEIDYIQDHDYEDLEAELKMLSVTNKKAF
ncbi:Hypothetical predicted protein [Pelobates cultripes]|uniref:CABIT domain-containing protein n=1 Tax=Pelobates cultripes TaxID=61616 RepID=A0AAD1R241_PELCU|nr:Hypothetical predicted protein [Pelobates cultripes]